MINESAKNKSVPLMQAQVKKISTYVIGRADEYGSFKQKGDEDSEKICKYLYEYISERRT